MLVTDAVIKKLQMDGGYKIVPVSEADAVLRGTITEVSRRQFRASRVDTLVTTEILVGLVVKYTVDANTAELLATIPPPAVPVVPGAEVKISKTLLAGQTRDASNIVVNPNYQLSIRQALADAAERLSGDIAGQLTVGW